MESQNHVISLNYPQKTVLKLNYNFSFSYQISYNILNYNSTTWTTIQITIIFKTQRKSVFSSKTRQSIYSKRRCLLGGALASGETAPSDKQTKKTAPTALGWHHHDLPLRLSWEWLGWKQQEAWGESSEMSLMPETSMMFPSEKPCKTTCRLVMSAFRWTLMASINSTSQQDGQPSVTGRRASPSFSQKEDPTIRFQSTSVFHMWIKQPNGI